MPWLNNCLANHVECREMQSHDNWLPTRLIDVDLSSSQPKPRLVITSQLGVGTNASYVTLSHRWASTNVLELKSSNLDSFKERIPMETLSTTFLDAIKVTRDLGFRYLWIDSLCIIQNSQADWQSESVEMGKSMGDPYSILQQLAPLIMGVACFKREANIG